MTSTPKIDRRVGRVIDLLRHGKPARALISRESEANLKRLALLRPEMTREFIKTLVRLDRLALPIEKLVVPAVLAEVQNQKVLQELRSMGFVGNLICANDGVLDLRKAGLKQELGFIDLTPKYQPLQLADFRRIMDDALPKMKGDQMLATLFLFKAVMRLRIDLFVAGEERSKLVKRGEKPGLTPAFIALQEFCGRLAADFPFGRTTERQQLKEGIEIAAVLIGLQNNPAAEAKLTSVFDSLETVLTRQIVERTAARPKEVKIEYRNKGLWQVRTSGFRRTELGLKQKDKVVSEVRTPELLSMLGHIRESIEEERTENFLTMMDVAALKQHYPDRWDRLFELYLSFSAFNAAKKEKARSEMEGALELARVGTDQALRMAKSLLSLAENDLEARNEELAAQHWRFVTLEREVEEKIGRQLADFAGQVVAEIVRPEMLFDLETVFKVEARLGAYMGTFLRGELREDWLRRAKSRVVGVKQALQRVRGRLEQKQHFLQLTNEIRLNFQVERGQIWEARTSLATKKKELARLRREVLGLVGKNLETIAKINAELQVGLSNAARYLVLMNADFANRHERTVEPKEVQAQAPAFPALASELVETLGTDGEVLGRAFRREAVAMGLRFREISA